MANSKSYSNYLLREQFPLQNGFQDTHHVQVNHVWRSTPQEFIQMVYVDPSHWICVSNIGCDKGYVGRLWLDDKYPWSCATILKSQNNDSIGINVVNVQPQIGGADCGLFAAAVATDLCFDIDPSTFSYLQADMRPHMELFKSTETWAAFHQLIV